MRTQKSPGLAALAAVAVIAALPMPAVAAEEAVISAFSTWQGVGQLMQTAASGATFVGTLDGIVYVNTDKGPVEAGQMVCPAVVQIDLTSGKQTGTGNCTITVSDGAQVFSELTCSGVHLVGCSGEMKLTGGTGRFEGVAGGGAFTLRSSLRDIKPTTAASAQETAHGIIFWPQLRYTLP
jgi:hypothetical protein